MFPMQYYPILLIAALSLVPCLMLSQPTSMANQNVQQQEAVNLPDIQLMAKLQAMNNEDELDESMWSSEESNTDDINDDSETMISEDAMYAMTNGVSEMSADQESDMEDLTLIDDAEVLTNMTINLNSTETGPAYVPEIPADEEQMQEESVSEAEASLSPLSVPEFPPEVVSQQEESQESTISKNTIVMLASALGVVASIALISLIFVKLEFRRRLRDTFNQGYLRQPEWEEFELA
jgi:hypothetical protein